MSDLISEYRDHLHDLRRAKATVDIYVDVLRRMDRELPAGLYRAHADEIKEWIDRPHRSNATLALYRSIAMGFFTWACDPNHQRLDFNPAVLVPRVRVPEVAHQPLADAALGDLLRRGGEPYTTWFLLAAMAGLRCCELAGLDRKHVTEQHVWVRGKGQKERLIPTHPLVWAAVRDLEPGLVCGGADRKEVSRRGNHRIHQLGHDDMSMHSLRRWFGTSVFEAAGNNLRVAQQLLGHSTIATTQRYLLVAEPARALAVAGLPMVA